jgi:HD-GYP domain-containing protein (c-di-GMP phosphodiesterase class II)
MPKFSDKMDSLHDRISRELVSAAGGTSGASEGGADGRTILQAIPDLIFRVRRNGVVSVVGHGSDHHPSPHAPTIRRNPADAASKPRGQPVKKVEPWDPAKSLSEELARRSKELVPNVVEAGRVQVLDIQLSHDSQTVWYEVHAAAYDRNEILAVARDVTARREAEEALKKRGNDLEVKVQEQSNELNQLKEAFQNQVTLLAQEEEVLKSSFDKVERLLEGTIGAIAAIVQKKDPYTAGHQQRVSQLACAIGREMSLNAEQLRVIRIASLLHDLGKVFIPAEFLSKPGKLNEIEFRMVKAHPDADYEILKAIDFSCDIADIVRQHHERLDGSGYPSGLKGDAIHLESKIIAVADVVEAMVSSRPYRPALGVDAAMKEIENGKGTLYDPVAVDACVKLFHEGEFTFEFEGRVGG